MDKAKKILKDIVDRKHPRFLGERKLTEEMKHRWEEDLADGQDDGLTPEDFEVDFVKFDYGMKTKNPIDEMRFYKKRTPTVANRLPEHQKSVFHPTCFSEWLIRVYYKNTDEDSVDKAYHRMALWCDTKHADLK
ncbi:deoxynucleoside triphosphate triphosphohydrolase SAMHD1-like isoform 1-T1 [Lycodopsis pacificus]